MNSISIDTDDNHSESRCGAALFLHATLYLLRLVYLARISLIPAFDGFLDTWILHDIYPS